MLWLIFDGWLRFDTEGDDGKGSFAFSSEKKGDIEFFVPKSQIGKVTFEKSGDQRPSSSRFDMKIEAIEMIDWLADKLAEEHKLKVEK